MRQIEQMESEELLAQKKLRTEVIQLEDMLAQVSRLEVEKLSSDIPLVGPCKVELNIFCIFSLLPSILPC